MREKRMVLGHARCAQEGQIEKRTATGMADLRKWERSVQMGEAESHLVPRYFLGEFEIDVVLHFSLARSTSFSDVHLDANNM